MIVTKQINVESAVTVKPSNGELIGSGIPQHGSLYHVGRKGKLAIAPCKVVTESRTRAVTLYGGELTLGGDKYGDYNGVGLLCQVDMGSVSIRNWKQSKRANDYCLYLGNWQVSQATNGKDDGICEASIEGCDFSRGSRDEAAVRCMRMHGELSLCTFGNPDNTQKKECLQPRHERIVIENCTMLHSASNGNLAPDVDGGIHARWAKTHPTWLHYNGGALTGYMKTAGNCKVVVSGLSVMGNDPRGVGGARPFYQESHTIDGVKMTPEVILVGVVAAGKWDGLAGGGVVVGPGCFLNGKRVPQSSNYSEKRMREIIAEANKWA